MSQLQKIMVRLRYPIPLIWGLLALLLFFAFSGTAILRFNSIQRDELEISREFDKINTYAIYLNQLALYQASIDITAQCEHSKEAALLGQDALKLVLLYLERIKDSDQISLDDLNTKIDNLLGPYISLNCPDVLPIPVEPER